MALTNQYRDYYGEEVDPSLAAMLGRATNKVNEAEHASVASNETIDLKTTAMEVRNTTVVT